MKKIYVILVLFLFSCFGVFAQSQSNKKVTEKRTNQIEPVYIKDGQVVTADEFDTNKDGQVVIFEDDFSNPDTWVIAHDPSGFDMEWQIGIGLTPQGDFPIAPLQSTTADNGYAMLDSDAGNNTTGLEEDSWLTTANPVDLTDYAHVVVQFETTYRSWTDENCYLVVSTDPDVWPDLTAADNADDFPGVYKVFPDIIFGSPSAQIDNPTIIEINISDFAANQPEIYIRFNWTGIWGYAWFVDDVKVIEQPANDIKLINTIMSHNGFGDSNFDPVDTTVREQYARMPASEVSKFYVEGKSFVFGYEPQTNVESSIEVVNESDDVVMAAVDLNGDLNPEDTIVTGGDLDFDPEVGVYTATFMVQSDEEQPGSENFWNNVIVRKFEISTDYYAMDGIGLNEDPKLTSFTVGSTANPDDADGYRIMVHYDIQNSLEVYGIEFLLRQDRTEPGGFVVVSILDSTMVLDETFDDPLAESDDYEITQEDIDAGYKRIYFAEPVTIDGQPVYASVEMFVDPDGATPISLWDDNTVKQPDLSSVIFVPSDNTVYTNTNGAAIRLLLNGAVGINEVQQDAASLGQNVPNPANALTRIDFELQKSQNVTIIVTDMTGKIIARDYLGKLSQGAHQYVYDVSNLKAGIYQYTILTDNGKVSKSMTVIK